MIFKVNKKAIPLENRLFINANQFALILMLILMPVDLFYTHDLGSFLVEICSSIFFLANFLIVRHSKIRKGQIYLFSVLILVFLDLSWLGGSLYGLLNFGIFFLCLALIFLLNDKKHYPLIAAAGLLNHFLLFCLHYFTNFNQMKGIEITRPEILYDFLIALFIIGAGCYLIIFVKINFNIERDNLAKANKQLNYKTEEITIQNEKLETSKEVLDEIILELEGQKKELTEIKGSLEEKVEQRTSDLLKVNERLLAQNQQLEQYAYITSHNLRAPVAQIKGLVHLLPTDNAFKDITVETMDRLHGSIINLDKVLNDLSMILQLEKNMKQPWQEVNLYSEVSGVIDALKGIIDQKGIEIKVSIAENSNIMAIRSYVYSVIHNIIENSVKYTDDKKEGSHIEIKSKKVMDYHIISISDNGIGIDMEMASGKIFQMYQRFNNTHPGQGFGLFLVKSQMEAMQGKVELESQLGLGTTFHLKFLIR